MLCHLSSLEVSFGAGGVEVVGGCHLSEDPWGRQGEGQLLGPARDDLPGPFPLSCAHMETAHPQPPPPVPACVNFSNICFPWPLVGLVWEGREFLELPEAALSPFHPCRLSSAEEAISKLPLRFQPSGPPSETWGAGVSPFLFSLGLAQHPIPHGREDWKPLGSGALLAQGSPLRVEASTGPLGQG